MRLPLFFPLIALISGTSIADNGEKLATYFRNEVEAIEAAPQPVPGSVADWETMRAAGKAKLADMLGLSPMPERTPLNAVKTGEVTGDGFVVENLHFQSRPGLYVTANLYRPAKGEGRLPTILYVCGHSEMKAKDGASLGNKAGYQHHGEWFARRGYVCLVIDTVQLGEIRGEHHGTYRLNRWWWISRGYTPAGLEAWSGIRALDYLETRSDVDATRIGVTGRSGGGAYSWWIAALDDRIKVAAPTAGITTLRNHVVDGCVSGHCDCMFMVNSQRWDYDRVAALVAPRPLLISNTDKDDIFPLDGVMAVHASVRRVYRALGADSKLGLQIAEGPHKDTQPLNVGAFAWFERFLKGADSMALLDEPAKKHLEPDSLRVLSERPKDQINTTADDEFVPRNTVKVDALREQVFGGWPQKACDLASEAVPRSESGGVAWQAWDFTSQEPWRLRLFVVCDAGVKPSEIERVTLEPLGDDGWARLGQFLPANSPLTADNVFDAAAKEFGSLKKQIIGTKNAIAFVCPRGVGPTAWTGTEKEQTHRLRRFYLLGQTLDGMRVWDIRRAISALRTTPFSKAALHLRGTAEVGVNALYASMFEDGVASVELENPPVSHMKAPVYLGILRVMDIPQAVALAAARTKVVVLAEREADWQSARDSLAKSGRPGSLEIRTMAK